MEPAKPTLTERLSLKNIEFRESVEMQIILLGELRMMSIKLQHFEQAATYRSMEKDFEDLSKYLDDTNNSL